MNKKLKLKTFVIKEKYKKSDKRFTYLPLLRLLKIMMKNNNN